MRLPKQSESVSRTRVASQVNLERGLTAQSCWLNGQITSEGGRSCQNGSAMFCQNGYWLPLGYKC
jgi:hypothetical protein